MSLLPRLTVNLILALGLISLFTAAALPEAAAEWKESVLYSFQGVPDGQSPVGSVVFDKAGNLYGATKEGGSASCISIFQCGTVFQLSPPAKPGDPWTETVLYVFKGNKGDDGASPLGGLVMDKAGNLYGTTGYGGTGNCVLLGVLMGCGAVFELSPPAHPGDSWKERVLYSFPSSQEGYVPNGDLVFDSAGNLYGATMFGGGKGTTCNDFYQYCGAVFELSPPKKGGNKWKAKKLHAFAGGRDGTNPNGGLVLDTSGAIYGTTLGGGDESGECDGGEQGTGCGTVFKLMPPVGGTGHWTEEVLHRFHLGDDDGAQPAAGVILDESGNLFGTTYGGPENGSGTVFELAKPVGQSRVWKETLLYRFMGAQEGANPAAALIFGSDGSLLGTTAVATNQDDQGTVFRLEPPTGHGKTWTLKVGYTFLGPPDGAYPASPLVRGKAGAHYGTTQLGGTGQNCGAGNCGTVFEVKP